MRIAMIGHKRIPSREGGIEIVVDVCFVSPEAADTRMVHDGMNGIPDPGAGPEGIEVWGKQVVILSLQIIYQAFKLNVSVPYSSVFAYCVF